MGGDTGKNDIKTLFFICNSFSAALVGLQCFSSGVGNGALKPMETMDIINIVVGLVYIGIAVSGYVGASTGSTKLLRVYFGVMCARSICNVTRLVRWDNLDASAMATGRYGSPKEVYAAMIVDTVITMVSVLVSLTLGVYATN